MGTCNSCPIRTHGYEIVTDLRSFCFLERAAAVLSISNSGPVMVTKEHFVNTLHKSSSYWVYARFSDQDHFLPPRIYALDIKAEKYLRLPNDPMITYSDNATSVFDYNLYIIGRRRTGRFVCSGASMFIPVLHNWSYTIHTLVQRREALAVSVHGKIFVFGGRDVQIGEWAEVYEPSTRRWALIPGSQAVSDALDSGLAPLGASAVLGNKIILKGPRNGIAFDVMSNSWTPVSQNLIKGWRECIRAAVVKNMLITCHSEYVQHEIHQLSIRAYDPDQDVWLMLEGIDSSFHENAHRSQFMAVNGKLVIYHMLEKNDLRYSIFQIKEKRRTTVRANLLWQSRFPISKIIKQGPNTSPEHSESEHEYTQSFVEALRADRL